MVLRCRYKRESPVESSWGEVMHRAMCDCQSDGYCPRYRTLMTGRKREICQGINVDPGEAAVLRDHWARESASTVSGWRSSNAMEERRRLLMKTDQRVGDAVAMTAAIYSLHRKYPGRFLTAVESPWLEVFAFNPDVVPADSIPDAEPLQMHYPSIHAANERAVHFMGAWCEHLGDALGIDVPLLTNRPRLYFDKAQPTARDYWIVCSGGSTDMTNKLWGHSNYQKTVNLTSGRVKWVQVGANDQDHQPLFCHMRAVGKTGLRDLFDLVRECRGVLCGVSLLMHVAAALEKPTVVIAGGREPVQWNAYPRQHYLHTVGVLPCCKSGGCWRARVQPIHDGSQFDEMPCERPSLASFGTVIPECMAMILPEEVAEKILTIDAYLTNA
jgi:ADP-heptose:LPS heptosyltransferase